MGGAKSRSFEGHEGEARTIPNYQLPRLDRPAEMRTLAINSLFLNSPLTSVTLPCSSSSVHRILSSFVGRMMRPRLLPKPVEPGDVSSGGGGGACNWASRRIFADLNMFHELFKRVVEKFRCVASSTDGTIPFEGCPMASELSRASRQREVANVLLSEPFLLFTVCMFALHIFPERHPILLLVTNPRCSLFAWVHCANGRSKALLTWARRKLRTDGEGAATL